MAVGLAAAYIEAAEGRQAKMKAPVVWDSENCAAAVFMADQTNFRGGSSGRQIARSTLSVEHLWSGETAGAASWARFHDLFDFPHDTLETTPGAATR